VKRGDIWTVAGGAAYTGKPRPAVILQDNAFGNNDSVVVCPLTTDPTEAPTFRIRIIPTSENGLVISCALMVDKLSAVPRTRLQQRVGSLDDDAMLRLSRTVAAFLGLGAGTSR
jgi:mRNA interferase MazF